MIWDPWIWYLIGVMKTPMISATSNRVYSEMYTTGFRVYSSLYSTPIALDRLNNV